jgi:hypothetical protein
MADQTDHPPDLEAAGGPGGSGHQPWLDLFVLQLTSQQVASADIDRAVADVNAYCVDSGQSPERGFGDPRSYATTLAAALPPAAKAPILDGRRIAVLLPTMVGLTLATLGLLARAGADQNRVGVTLGQILLAFVAVPAWVVLSAPLARPRRRDPATPHRPAFDESGWRGLWATLGLVAVGAGLCLGLTMTVFTMSAWVVIGLGWALVLAAQVYWRLSRKRSGHPRGPGRPGPAPDPARTRP